MHALLPALRGSFVHPTALNPTGTASASVAGASPGTATAPSPAAAAEASLLLLADPMFRDTVFVSSFCASFLRESLKVKGRIYRNDKS